MRDRGVGAAQFFKGQGRRQGAGVPNFETILEEHDLDAGITGVVAVNDGVDDGLGDNFLEEYQVFLPSAALFFQLLRRSRGECLHLADGYTIKPF